MTDVLYIATWPAGKIALHASSDMEAKKQALEYIQKQSVISVKREMKTPEVTEGTK